MGAALLLLVRGEAEEELRGRSRWISRKNRRSGSGWLAEKNKEDAAATEGMDPEGDLECVGG